MTIVPIDKIAEYLSQMVYPQHVDNEPEIIDALNRLDGNNDGGLEENEVADEAGYLRCDVRTNNWLFTKFGPVEDVLYAAGLIKRKRSRACVAQRPTKPDQIEVVDIYYGQYAITRPGNNRRTILGTQSVVTCTALVLYDKKTRTGVMAHLLPVETAVKPSIKRIMEDLEKFGVDVGQMEARMIGGARLHEYGYESEIRRELADRGIKIIEQDYNHAFGEDVMLDTETGEVYNYDTHINRLDICSRKLPDYDREREETAILTPTEQPGTLHTSKTPSDCDR